jgi:hypothetical protein
MVDGYCLSAIVYPLASFGQNLVSTGHRFIALDCYQNFLAFCQAALW